MNKDCNGYNNCDYCVYLFSCRLLNGYIQGWNTSAYPNRMKKELPLICGRFKEKNNSERYSDIGPLTLVEMKIK